MVIIIDNYDSFTFNLFQFIGMLTDEVKVYRNDQITVEAIEALQRILFCHQDLVFLKMQEYAKLF